MTEDGAKPVKEEVVTTGASESKAPDDEVKKPRYRQIVIETDGNHWFVRKGESTRLEFIQIVEEVLEHLRGGV